MIYLLVTVLLVYCVLILIFIRGFDKVKIIQKTNVAPSTKFAIVVPFRNEENNIINLLNSISQLDYPKNLFELIVIDDDSDDDSVLIFNEWQKQNPEILSQLLQNYRMSNSPKKDAISVAIEAMKNDWIITTDADCELQINWLTIFDNHIQTTSSEMVAGAVFVNNQKRFLNFFQFIDLLSLQGTTIGSFGVKRPFMCNGANFAYTKKLFHELNGFDGNHKIASGDDVFLLQKALKFLPEKVAYLKNKQAIVFTNPEKTWQSLFQQRVRWASKTSAYDSFFGKFVAIAVFAMNAMIVTLVFATFLNPVNLSMTIALFGVKILVDYFLLTKTHRFVTNEMLIFPILSSLFYPFFCVSVALYSFFGRYKWKNRDFRNQLQ